MNQNPRITPLLLFGQFTAFLALAIPERRATRSPSRPRRWLGRALILGGGTLAAAGAATLGEHLRATPAPPAGAPLRTGGPYGVTRHPIYTGLMLAALGRVLTSGGRRHLTAMLALGGIFAVKTHYEEALLDQVTDYRRYQERVPRWGIKPPKK